MLNIDFTFIWLCFQISFQVCKYVIKLSGSKKKKTALNGTVMFTTII